METTVAYWGYIGIMEKKMETAVVYWGYIGIDATGFPNPKAQSLNPKHSILITSFSQAYGKPSLRNSHVS